MAWFLCNVGSGGKMTVTCASVFAGLTITCTDGVNTFTSVCPSVSPYEVTFSGIKPNTIYTISTTYNGNVYSTTAEVSTNFNFNDYNTKTITVYSAPLDTIVFTDAEGTKVIITDADGKAENVEVSYNFNVPITFTSSVAKDTSDITQDYAKTITVDNNTTEIYLMPDNFIYWYGIMNSNYGAGDCKTLGYTNAIENYTIGNIILDTNSARPSWGGTSSTTEGIGTNEQIDLTDFNSLKAIVSKTGNTESGKFAGSFVNSSKTVIRNYYYNFTGTRVATQDISSQTGSKYVGVQCNWLVEGFTIYALWLE